MPKKPMKQAGGPFVQMALICEKVLQEPGGVISPIRVVDRMFINVPQGTTWPQPVQLIYYVVIALKSGAARGSRSILVRLEGPDGQPAAPESRFPVLFEAEDRGIQIIVQSLLSPRLEGLYWYDVMLDDQPLTRIPLRIVVQQISIGPPPQV